jgi:TolB protein
MKRKLQTVAQILCLLGLIGGLEYYFFRMPELQAASAAAAVYPEAAPPLPAELPALQFAAGLGQPALVPTDPPPAVAALLEAPRVQLIQAQPNERRLRNIRQLTFGGTNAEAYWSPDGTQIIFQATRDGLKADQIFIMDAAGQNPRMVSTGKGRTTCGYFVGSGQDQRILFSSTHPGGDEPPPPPDHSMGYVWAIYPTYEVFTARPDGSDLRPLTQNPGYDAEATVSPDGKRIVFTSLRDGDLDIYTMDIDGGNLKRLTNKLGYDGGAFFSPDGSLICYRAQHPETPEEQQAYRDLLARNLVRPSVMDLWVMKGDGTNKRRVLSNGAANFAPYFTPDGKRLIFSSNLNQPGGRNFDLFLVNLDGSRLEQVTFNPTFDGFPMFSPDGKKLLWASKRNAQSREETNVFVADWVD